MSEIMEVPLLRGCGGVGGEQCVCVRARVGVRVSVPSCSLEPLDELLNLPHFDILGRLVLGLLVVFVIIAPHFSWSRLPRGLGREIS